MRYTNIEDLKKNARIDGDEENEYLEECCITAEAIVLEILNRTFEDIVEKYGVVPPPVRHATLMLATYYYNNREPDKGANNALCPDNVEILLKPYMVL